MRRRWARILTRTGGWKSDQCPLFSTGPSYSNPPPGLHFHIRSSQCFLVGRPLLLFSLGHHHHSLLPFSQFPFRNRSQFWRMSDAGVCEERKQEPLFSFHAKKTNDAKIRRLSDYWKPSSFLRRANLGKGSHSQQCISMSEWPCQFYDSTNKTPTFCPLSFKWSGLKIRKGTEPVKRTKRRRSRSRKRHWKHLVLIWAVIL